jgi:hypothetical protein
MDMRNREHKQHKYNNLNNNRLYFTDSCINTIYTELSSAYPKIR